MYDIQELWRFLPLGYCLTVMIEIPVLLIRLSKVHSLKTRLIAGFGLTAFTYPVVVLVLPLVMAEQSRAAYYIVAEIFAPVAECIVFAMLFHGASAVVRVAGKVRARDFVAIVVANLCSFGLGELARWFGWLA